MSTANLFLMVNVDGLLTREVTLFRSILLLLLQSSVLLKAAAPDPVYAPLWLYNGSWDVTRQNAAGTKPDRLVNQCALLGKYFACEQMVNGSPTMLLIFIPAKENGHYYTQSVMPDGRAAGRGNLEIDGDKWVFSSNWNQGGKTTFYRTLNTFSGKNRIHFEQQESSNNREWSTTGSGDDVRASAGRR